jgi:hypothetical protein
MKPQFFVSSASAGATALAANRLRIWFKPQFFDRKKARPRFRDLACNMPNKV